MGYQPHKNYGPLKVYLRFVNYFSRHKRIDSYNFPFKYRYTEQREIFYLDIEHPYIDSNSVSSFLREWYNSKDLKNL
jgi:hypothetical protein